MPVHLQIGFLIVLFVAGLIARRSGWLTRPQAGKMVQLVITVGLPALFLSDVSRIPLHRDLIALPAVAVVVMLLTLLAALVVGRWMGLGRPSYGAFVICSMSINNAFLFPFVIAGWGQQAFAQLALFDLGNTVIQATVIYGVAAVFGGHGAGALALLKRMLSFPPLWALIVALGINLGGLHLPPLLTTVLGFTGRTILLLVVLALGVLFDAKLLRSGSVLGVLALRIGLGLAIGLACVEVFGLTGLTRAVLLLGSAAPIGFSAVVIASREHLDRELAASAASLSVLLGLFYVPLALWLLHQP
jgi:predicted permease